MRNLAITNGKGDPLHTYQCIQKDAIEIWREDAIQNSLLGENVKEDDHNSLKGVGNIGTGENDHCRVKDGVTAD